MNVKKMIRDTLKDEFKRNLILALCILGIFLLINPFSGSSAVSTGDNEVHFFFHPQCPHCQQQKPLMDEFETKYPGITIARHDVSMEKERSLMISYANQAGISPSRFGVPLTFVGNAHFMGFDSKETTGKEIETAIIELQKGNTVESAEARPSSTVVALPFLGEIDALDYSIPLLAVILGLIDGFNPCAMWVLVYLISLIISLDDRRKVWLLVGSFVLASGILYFLFMTAWLNAFLLIGYVKPLTIIIGLWALYFGITSLKEYIDNKGAVVCKVSDGKSQESMFKKMENIVKSPLTLTTVLGIIGLAFVVNSIEFVCSSALPAVFTHVLSISNSSGLQYYMYILLYVFFFMLDDLIIFGLAAFALNTSIGNKYAKYCHLIGSIILVLVGIILVFFPSVLR